VAEQVQQFAEGLATVVQRGQHPGLGRVDGAALAVVGVEPEVLAEHQVVARIPGGELDLRTLATQRVKR
jgi:hypothetical protein